MFAFKTLEEKFQTVPDDVKEAILSAEVNQKLQGIIAKHHLQLDEGEDLTKEIGYVMLGLKKPEDFVSNVQAATELDKKTAETIVKEVNETIFKEIKESLREIHHQREKDDLSEAEEDAVKQEQLRRELMQELEKEKDEKDDLIIQPEEENSPPPIPPKETLPKEKNIKESGEKKISPAKKTNQPITDNQEENLPQATGTDEQKQPKKYIIDPYREPLE